ncbi:MAG: arylsulfatase A-like enzyme [Verrucomicrobiales bacterium]|jgi:arylsulfatase A-like enzyme
MIRFSVALATLTIFVAVAATAFAERKPNIVILFSDDAGYADFGFVDGADPRLAALTPRITKLAYEGARFTNAYVSGAVCSPSRAGLLTGRYQQRFGHEKNIPPGYMKGGLPLSEKFIGDRLKPLGYTTALIGKWHLGYPAAFQPNQRGFDHFYGCLQGARSYHPYKNPTPHKVILENTTPTPEGGYTTDRIGTGACNFIERHKAVPFFMLVSFTAPHGPLEPREGESLSGFDKPKRRKFAGLVKALDENVGRILDKLEAEGLARDTLVIFTSDNGGQTMVGADNGVLRGRKGQLWEGGIRVPMAMRWPGKISAESIIEDPVITLDFLPTFLAAAGGKVDPSWKLDGINLLPRITGESPSLAQRDLFWRGGGSKGTIATRQGKWKLIDREASSSGQPLLFDLSSDISETTNLAPSNADIVTKLRSRISSWEAQLIEPLWGSTGKKRK